MRRLLLVVAFSAVAAGCASTAKAGPGCPPGGAPPPAAAAHRDIANLDGGGPSTLWVGGGVNRVVGITTASGANSDVQITSASPIPLSALAIDAQDNGGNQIIVSDGRSARLYTFADCRIQTVVDAHYGRPFVFDLQNLRDNGTGVGCSDLGDGRHLVGLQAVNNAGQWAVRRTEIDLNGIVATTGRSDTVTATSAQDPAVTSAQTISCGDLTISKDGVQQP
jgi:hypothetical protein